ncbi:hypothetical protein DFQ27_002103, partial [Actinomortierella ambigua]
MNFVDSDTLHFVGQVIKNTDDPRRHPVASKSSQRRCATSDGKWRQLWREQKQQGCTLEDVEKMIAEAKDDVDKTKSQLDASRRRLNQHRARSKAACRIFNKDKSNSESFSVMKNQQAIEREAAKDVSKHAEMRSDVFKKLYFWRKIKSAATSTTRLARKTEATVEQSKPTWDFPAAEDTPSSIDATPILAGHGQTVNGKKRLVACWAEDPGLRVMSHNIPRTIEEMQQSVNRFQVLE